MGNSILDATLGFLKIIFVVARNEKFALNYFCIVAFKLRKIGISTYLYLHDIEWVKNDADFREKA